MAERPQRASIVSGYFNPFHHGHLDLFEQARERTGFLIVVVNNDVQQRLKKGRVIQSEDVRARIVAALRCVDDTFVAQEAGPGIDETFDAIRARYPEHPDPGRARGGSLTTSSPTAAPPQCRNRASHSAPPSTAVNRSQRPSRPSPRKSASCMRS
jgi:cytidyltransferase-like protein